MLHRESINFGVRAARERVWTLTEWELFTGGDDAIPGVDAPEVDDPDETPWERVNLLSRSRRLHARNKGAHENEIVDELRPRGGSPTRGARAARVCEPAVNERPALSTQRDGDCNGVSRVDAHTERWRVTRCTTAYMNRNMMRSVMPPSSVAICGVQVCKIAQIGVLSNWSSLAIRARKVRRTDRPGRLFRLPIASVISHAGLGRDFTAMHSYSAVMFGS